MTKTWKTKKTMSEQMKAKSEKWRYDGKCGCSVYEACPRCIGIYEQGKKASILSDAKILEAKRELLRKIRDEYNGFNYVFDDDFDDYLEKIDEFFELKQIKANERKVKEELSKDEI